VNTACPIGRLRIPPTGSPQPTHRWIRGGCTTAGESEVPFPRPPQDRFIHFPCDGQVRRLTRIFADGSRTDFPKATDCMNK